MAGVAGSNQDVAGFILDPTLADVQQHWKELGAHPNLTRSVQHVIGGYRTVKIPTASVLTLNTVPIQIVPAPGAGLLIVPITMVATLVYNSTTYATNAAGASLKYGADGTGGTPGLALTQAFLQAASGTNHIVVQASATAYLPSNSTDVNAALTLIASTTDPTTGNSDLWVRVYYQIIAVPFSGTQAP